MFDRDSLFAIIDDYGSSDKVWDAWIAKSFSGNLFSLAFIIFLRSAS